MPSPIRVLIQVRLADGRLPLNGTTRVWGIPGNGETCAACGQIVTTSEFVIEGIGDDEEARNPTPIYLHVGCFRLWDEERRPMLAAKKEKKG